MATAAARVVETDSLAVMSKSELSAASRSLRDLVLLLLLLLLM